MSEETNNKQTGKLRTTIGHLLVLDKEKMKIQAVKSIDENGKMKPLTHQKTKTSLCVWIKRRFLFQLLFQLLEPVKNPTNFSFLQ
jgi:hypothetical protein